MAELSFMTGTTIPGWNFDLNIMEFYMQVATTPYAYPMAFFIRLVKKEIKIDHIFGFYEHFR